MVLVIKKIRVIITVGLFFFLFIFFTLLSFHRFNILQVFFYDFGIFARIIFQLSQFQPPFIHDTYLSSRYIFFLGDHFNPSLILIAPVFWISTHLKILLVEQALVSVAGGVMIFLIARKYQLSYISSLLASLTHLFFAGTLNPLVTDWHPESTAGFFLLLFFYLFCFTKKKKWAYVAAGIFLGFKESNAVSLIFLLAWLFFIAKKKRNTILFLFIIAFVWFFATTKIFIPFFSHRSYFYTPAIPGSLFQIIGNFFNHPAKIKLMTDSLGSFGFLPILSFTGLIPVIGEFAIRLVPIKSFFQSYNLTMHYNVYLGCFLSLGSVYAVVSVKRWVLPRFKKIAEILLITYLFGSAIFMARKTTYSPINLIISPVFWKERGTKNDFFSVLKKIPRQGSVMSQNNILPLLVERKDKVYLFSDSMQNIRADSIIFDLSDGNINNFWPSTKQKIRNRIEILLRDSSYRRLPTNNKGKAELDNKNIFIFIKK